MHVCCKRCIVLGEKFRLQICFVVASSAGRSGPLPKIFEGGENLFRGASSKSTSRRHCPKKPGQERKPAICPTKLSILKNVYVARLVSKGMPERFAKVGAKDVTRFINEKITELRRLDSRRKAAQEKFDLEGAVEPEGNA
ncbi:uncharacterized protein LOC120841140 [Ixodes scapularis]|uniref:uncharacterized protein LOC120841140 n=1 Tax=Ixodes scapularis TaxID=6945 RepID=UPI001A9E2D14|nr:uncharacterized protein LOC120841140 [Ixodes scapularis]